MKNKILLFGILLLCANAHSAGYWLRGDDFTTFLEGNKVNFMTSTSPNASSTETTFRADETGLVGKWYSTAFNEGMQLHTSIGIWLNGITGNGLRWAAYDFDQGTQNSILIAESEIRGNGIASEAKLEKPYALKEGRRIKLVISADSNATTLLLDNPHLFATTLIVTSLGETFEAQRVKETGLFYFGECSFSKIECSNNLGCNDSNPYTKDTCNNQGTCESQCSYSPCEPLCVNGKDCYDSNPLTIDYCSSGGSCEAQCENIQCEVQCENSLACDDGNESTKDECINPGTCFSACANAASQAKTTMMGCFEKECTGIICEQKPIPFCCGNGLCEQEEECEQDCAGNNITILSPKKGDYANAGEEFLFKVSAQKGTTVTARGFFGETQLYDDGKHFDGKKGDAIYANTVKINSAEASVQTIEISDSTSNVFAQLVIAPYLETVIRPDKEEFILGDTMLITGNVSNKGKPASAEIILGAEAAGKKIFETEQKLDEFGNFWYSYRSSLIDPQGEWVISVLGSDSEGNMADKKIKAKFFPPEEGLPLKIDFVNTPAPEYSRNSQINISVKITSAGKPVLGALVYLLFGSGQKLFFEEKDSGVYSIEDIVPEFVSSGEMKASIIAEKSGLQGKKEFQTSISEDPLKIVVTNQPQDSYSVGDEIKIDFMLQHADGSKPGEPVIQATIDGKPIEITENPEYFSVTYFPQKEGVFVLKISAKDPLGNTGEKEIIANVAGFALSYYLSENWFIAILLFAFLIAIGKTAYNFYGSSKKKTAMEKREEELTSLIQSIQFRYFKQGSLSRKKYDELMLKYEQELKTIKNQLGKYGDKK